MAPPRVRIRGIYATALTRLIDEVGEVVDPSRPIARRFDRSFAVDAVDVEVITTDDRQGIGLMGAHAGVDEVVTHLAPVDLDTLSWVDPTPRSAVFEADVIDTLGGGAVVDLDAREGYLPYDAARGYVEEGDRVRVQVHRPVPLWADHRPEVGMELRAYGGLVELVRGGEAHRAALDDETRATELVRATDVLPTDVPDGWVVRWQPAAADADTDTLDAALAGAAETAAEIEAALDGGDPQPESTTWLWFGRDSRFELDTVREAVLPTMAGHHRIKAASERAGTAVDFAEQLCAPDGSFPFDIVAEQFGPTVGGDIEISHGKPDGRRFSLGRATVTDRNGSTLTVRRQMGSGGDYDALGVPREDGDVAVTKFKEGRWWYPTAYRSATGKAKGTYVNVCTPVELFPDVATYIDLEVDVVKHADGRVERVDDDDLDSAVAAGHVSQPLAEKAREVAAAVERALG